MGLLVFSSGAMGFALTKILAEGNDKIKTLIITRPTPELSEYARSVPHLISEVYECYSREHLLSCKLGTYSWILNLWSSIILPPSVIRSASRSLNVHPGIVPDTRGSDCCTWAIRHGLPTGASLVEIADKVDFGRVYSKLEVERIFPESAQSVYARVKLACVELFRRDWQKIRDGVILPVECHDEKPAFRRAMTIKDKEGFDVQNAMQFVNWILAHQFDNQPGATIEADGGRYSLKLIIEKIK